jgi:HEAT repeat protein
MLSPERDVAARAVAAAAAAPATFRRDLALAARDDVALRRAVAEALARAKDVEGLLALAGDQDADVRLSVLKGLHASKNQAAIPVLLDAMRDADPSVRARALACLSQSPKRPAAEELAPALEQLVLAEKEPGVLKSAASLARSLGEPARPFVDRALASEEKRLRLFAVEALGPDPRLAKALEDPDEDVRVAAATGLSGNAEAVDALIKALDDESPRVVSAALRSLAKLGDAAAPAAGKLVERLAWGDDRMAGPLMQIGPPAVPSLIELPARQRDTLQRILRSSGPRAAPPLVELLGAKEAETRRKAAWALGLLGRDAEAAVPALTKALRDDGRFVAAQATWALGEIGAGARSAVPELEKLLEDPAKRQLAADALRRIRG